jgi:MFS family permease
MTPNKKEVVAVIKRDGNNDPVPVSDKLWTRNYTLLWVSMLTVFFGFNSLIPALPLYMEQYSSIAGFSGFPLAAMTIGAVLSRPVAGWCIDVYGRKNVYWGGILFFLLPCIVFMWMPAAPVIIASRFVQGLGWGFCHTALNTLASENVPPQRMGEGVGLFTSTTSIAMLITPTVGLWVIESYSFAHYFTSVTSLTLISMIPMIFVAYKAVEKKQEKPKLVFMSVAALQPATVMLLYCISNSAALSFISIHAMAQGISNPGLFYICFPLSSILVRPYWGRMIDRMREKRYVPVVVAGCIAQVIAMYVLANVSSVAHLDHRRKFFRYQLRRHAGFYACRQYQAGSS